MLSFILFALVRGLADTESFDLSLPLWAILLLSTVIEQLRARQEEQTGIASAAMSTRGLAIPAVQTAFRGGANSGP